MTMAGPDFREWPVRMTRWSGRRGRIRVVIVNGLVQATESALRRTRQWTEPLSGYVGVQINSLVRPGSSLGVRRWHEAVLRHRDPEKTIPLYSSQRLCDVRKVWKDAAVALDLPALERTPAGYIARETDELEKPYSSLGKVRLTERLAHTMRAPMTIECRHSGSVTRAILRLHGMEIIPALLLLTVGALFLFLGSLLGIVLGAAGFLFLLLGICARRGIEISPEGVSSSWMTPVGDFHRRTIPFKDLHTVVWTGPESSARRNAVLLLASDHTEITLDNLPRSQADWLGRAVLSAALGLEPRLRN